MYKKINKIEVSLKKETMIQFHEKEIRRIKFAKAEKQEKM